VVGSFALGFLGSTMKMVAFLALLLCGFGWVSQGFGPNAAYGALVCFALWVMGAYLKYVSRHTVRVRG
jgi:hypothetical protein